MSNSLSTIPFNNTQSISLSLFQTAALYRSVLPRNYAFLFKTYLYWKFTVQFILNATEEQLAHFRNDGLKHNVIKFFPFLKSICLQFFDFPFIPRKLYFLNPVIFKIDSTFKKVYLLTYFLIDICVLVRQTYNYL